MAEPDRYFFLRFQKTGGTSLTQRLREVLGPSAVYPGPNDPLDAVLSVDLLVRRFAVQRREIRLVAGHFPLCAMDRLDASFGTFTVLRDPVERTLSLLRNRAQRGGPRYRGQPLESIYEDPELEPIITNHMVKMLSMDAAEMGPAPLLQTLPLDETRLATAQERLGGIGVVGFQEEMSSLCQDLQQRFGWDLGPLRLTNSTEPRSISSTLRRRIAEDNALDVELYRLARRGSQRPPHPGRRDQPAAAGKLVITGTGRAGTTLLVQILDDLGLDTGLADGKLTPYGPTARAGLECRVDDPEAPTVVKDMTLGFRMREVLDAANVAIDHVLLPDRRLDIAAASRIRTAEYGRRPFRRGALTGTLRATEQEQILGRMRREILEALEDHEVPHTLLEFPRFSQDAGYTHAKLAPLVPGITLMDVERALQRCVRPELIHNQPLTRLERWRTAAATAWMVLYRLPVARLRERRDPAGQQQRLRVAVREARRREAELADAERRSGRVPTSARLRSGVGDESSSP